MPQDPALTISKTVNIMDDSKDIARLDSSLSVLSILLRLNAYFFLALIMWAASRVTFASPAYPAAEHALAYAGFWKRRVHAGEVERAARPARWLEMKAV